MIEINNTDTIEQLKGTGRTFVATISTGNTTFREITNLKHTFPFASNQKISIGETPSSFIEAEIRDCRLPLQNYELKVKLYFGQIQIPIGLFTVQEPGKVDGNGTQKIVAYDRMSNTSNFTYEAKGHTNAGDIFAEICSQCGYSAKIDDLTAISVSDDILDGYDCRTALGYLAGFLGANCIVGSDGKFKMVKYHIVDNLIEIDSLDTLDFPSNSSSVDYIFCTVDENTTVDVGTGNQGINIVNPLLSTTSDDRLQTVLNDIKSGIGNNYFAAKFKQLNGDPRIEVGDTLLVQHRNILTGEIEESYVPVMSLVREFDGGLSVSIEAYEPEKEFYISTTDQIKLLQNANKNTSKRTEAVAELNEVVSNALGLYKTEIAGGGGDVKTYYHNAPELSNSTYIFTMNAGGFAFTTGENCWNDGNPIWRNGITKDGNAIFNYLFAEKISANLIETGILKSNDETIFFDLNSGVLTSKGTLGFSDFYDGGISQEYKNLDDNSYVYSSFAGGVIRFDKIYNNENKQVQVWISADKMSCIVYEGENQTRHFEFSLTNGFWLKKLRLSEPLSINDGGTGVGTLHELEEDVLKLGDLAKKNISDIDSRYLRRYGLNEINIDNTNGCWTCDISEQGHGTIPEPWINVTQTSSGHFFSQIAVKCDNDGNAERKTRAMWVRNKYLSGAWSQWTGIQLL